MLGDAIFVDSLELAGLVKERNRRKWLELMMRGNTGVFVSFDYNNSIKPWGTYRKRSKRPKLLRTFKGFNTAIDWAMKEDSK